jgi:hypothetical protein
MQIEIVQHAYQSYVTDRVGGGSVGETGGKIRKTGRGARIHSRQVAVAGAEGEDR